MKKLLFIAIMVAIFSSCSKDEGGLNDLERKGLPVVISFAGGHSSSPALAWEDFPYAESWEKELKSVTLYAFREWGEECILQRSFTVSEIAAHTVTILLPTVRPGDLVYFYAVANTSTPRIRNLSQLEGIRYCVQIQIFFVKNYYYFCTSQRKTSIDTLY